MGKYDAVVKTLDREELDPRHQERVDLRKSELINSPNAPKTTGDLIRLYERARDRKDAINAKLKDVNVTVKALEQLVEVSFEVEQATSVKLEDGLALRIEKKPHAVIVDRETFRLWCVENGLEREMRLHNSTADSLVAEMLLHPVEGRAPLPPGTKAYVRTKFVLTGRKNEPPPSDDGSDEEDSEESLY